MFGFFKKIKSALAKTRSYLSSKLKSLFGQPWDDATLGKLEQILYEADLGTNCTAHIIDELKIFFRKNPKPSSDDVLDEMRRISLDILKSKPKLEPKSGHPQVILVVGVNGSGKTTSIAKLARHFQEEGKKVILGAADTFRAAAIEQLETWAQRLKIDIVKGQMGSDPSAVAFDALEAATARHADVVLIDTAGRLQNKTDLMHELKKISRVCDKVIPGAPHDILLVLDATMGQNALDQAKVFHEFTPLTGIILAKLDGSAKGGIVLSIYRELQIPIRWVGVGEGKDDLISFEAEEFVENLFEK